MDFTLSFQFVRSLGNARWILGSGSRTKLGFGLTPGFRFFVVGGLSIHGVGICGVLVVLLVLCVLLGLLVVYVLLLVLLVLYVLFFGIVGFVGFLFWLFWYCWFCFLACWKLILGIFREGSEGGGKGAAQSMASR